MAITGSTFFFSWEVALMEWIQAHMGNIGIYVMSFFSMFGEQLLTILIMEFIYLGYDKKLGRTLGLSLVMGMVWNPMIKNIFLRRRPYFDHQGIKILRVVDPGADAYDIASQGFSFPSGHATMSTTLYAGLARYKKTKLFIAVAVLIPLLVGISRFALGAHYPTDVVGGWILGALAIWIVPEMERRIANTKVLYGILLLSAIPGIFYCKSTDYFSCLGLLIGLMAGSILDEEKIQFENTKKPLRIILRMLGGMAIYAVLNTVLKMPFTTEFLNSGTFAALMVRCARYTIIGFAAFGIYPIFFRKETANC